MPQPQAHRWPASYVSPRVGISQHMPATAYWLEQGRSGADGISVKLVPCGDKALPDRSSLGRLDHRDGIDPNPALAAHGTRGWLARAPIRSV